MKKIILSAMATGAMLTSSAQSQIMTPDLLWSLGRVSMEDVSEDGNLVLYGVTRYNLEENSSERDLYIYDVEANEPRLVIDLPGSEGAAVFFDETHIGYAKDGQYWITEVGGTPIKLTNLPEGSGNFKPMKMKDGSWKLLFSVREKVFESSEDKYPALKQADFRIIDDLMYRHWDHWSDEYVNHPAFGALDLSGESMIESEGTDYTHLMKGSQFECPIPPFSGSESFTMSTDGKYVAYSTKEAVGKDFAVSTNSVIRLYNVETGETINVPGQMGYDTHPQFSPNNKYLAFTSMAHDGYESDENRLAIYDIAKNFTSILGEADDLQVEYINDFQWTENDEMVVNVPTMATQQLAEIELGRIKKDERISYEIEFLTSGDFNYNGFHAMDDLVFAERQDMNHATEIFIVEEGEEVLQLTHVNDGIYDLTDLSRIEKRMVETSDGKEMLTWVIYPPNFDETKKYPTLLYCQGGPQSPVSQFYSYRWNFQVMAAQGYIVVAPNRRGVQGFGSEWNEQISGDWGGQAMRDYLAAIDDVAQEPYVDTENLGAVGASYGGYSVYMLAGIHEGRFSAFISHCGLFNMESWYGSTEELFFANWDLGGPYWQSPQPLSYTQYNPAKFVQNWDTPILVIHGGKDFRVPENQGMEAFNAAQLQGVKSRFLYFPNEGHWVLNPQNGMVWHSEFFKWLSENLKD
ncbi:MAG: S9 family peptidase [Flavobacteriia bacterium]|nr:S9 family peptidase [Flavobacteriia bacterium]